MSRRRTSLKRFLNGYFPSRRKDMLYLKKKKKEEDGNLKYVVLKL